MRIIPPLIAVVVLAATATAHADPSGPGGVRSARHARLEHRFDIDRDGRLDPAERVALRSYAYARLVRRYDRNDRNRDGWIEPGEVILPRSQSRAR